MIILNTTFYIHPDLEADFADWIMRSYIPSALSAGLTNPKMSLILTKVDETMTGFALQLESDDINAAENWHDGHGAKIRGEFLGGKGEKALCFTTYMEQIPLGF